MHSRGVATREALVETAERLFAEQGIETVSLRDVSKAAGQRNHNAAQYHFGDRAGLVAAVYDHRMRHVNERRHAMLDLAAADHLDDDVPTLVAATVVPLTEVVAETRGWYGRFLARTQWDTFASGVVGELPVAASYRRVVDLLVARPARPAAIRPRQPHRPDGRAPHRHRRRLGVAAPPRRARAPPRHPADRPDHDHHRRPARRP